MIIQGIINQRIRINESTFVGFNTSDPNKGYICNLYLEFGGLLNSNYLKNHNCNIDFNNKQLITNFKTMPLHKVTEDNSVLNPT